MDAGRGTGGIHSVHDPEHDSTVQPGNNALRLVQVKVPSRSVQEEVLSKQEIKKVLDDLRCNEKWFCPCFVIL